MLPYRAKVVLRLATDTVSLTVSSRRLTGFDKLSAFGRNFIYYIYYYIYYYYLILGGILGLFTGISILSVVEVVFWTSRYIIRRYK